MSRIFVDTNIFVYAVDKRSSAKRKKARALIAKREKATVISTQVMQEFYVAVTKKLGVAPLHAKELLSYLKRLEIFPLSPSIVEDAVDCSIINQLSFWDALLVATAQVANCSTLWTEDLNHGQVIRGVEIVNPLL